MIQYHIVNNFIKVELNEVNEGANTEPSQKVILRLSVYEIHIDMLKKDANLFPCHMIKRTCMY